MESGKLQGINISSEDTGSLQNLDISLPVAKDEINYIVTERSLKVIRANEPSGRFSENLFDLAKKIGCLEFILIPLISRENLLGIILLGSATENALTPANLELYNSIAQMANTALEKIEASNRIAASFAELQSLSALSQVISTEIDLSNLFETLHRQVVQSLGDVNFLIALYDAETEFRIRKCPATASDQSEDRS